MSQKEASDDAEDVPSDFFDDFSKEEFMAGLSVVDSWDDAGGKTRTRINAEALDSVRDLRELIEGRDEEGEDRRHRRRRSRSIDNYIKPGSRRDLSKTNEAIKRDKAVKVKQKLTKHLESTDDLRPPGTELDDFFDDTKQIEKLTEERTQSRREVEKKQESPAKRRRRSPRKSPRRSPRKSPRRSPRRSPLRRLRRLPSPLRLGLSISRYNRLPLSPIRTSRIIGLNHLSRRRSRSRSPRRSPRRERRSRSRERRSRSRGRRSRSRRSRSRDRYPRRSRSRSLGHRDSFLYPREDPFLKELYLNREAFPDPGPFPSSAAQGYTYATPGVPFTAPVPYGEPAYGGQPPLPGDLMPMPAPLPVPAPAMAPGMLPHIPLPAEPMMPAPAPMMPGPAPMLSGAPPIVPAPPMVPAPQPPLPHISPVPSNRSSKMDIDLSDPHDALAKLVAEGKLSKEDYLKLAPNKSKSARLFGANVNNSSSVDTKYRVDAIGRCHGAVSKLSVLKIPKQLVMNSALFGPETKAITPRFCSPLKRQATVDFYYTTPDASAATLHNKQLIDAIVSKIGLADVVAHPQKKPPKNMKDAAVQTSKPYCDVCEIRDAIQTYDTGTSIDAEHFSCSAHTQVVEHELLSSKSVFAPSGAPPGNPMSIAHLTPAQLVSQLAARAKTLKQTDPEPPAANHYRRAPYDDDDYGRGQHYQDNYNNYTRY